MFSLVLLAVTPWLAFCMPPPTTTPSAPTTPPLPTTTSFVPTTMTTPAICICSDGTQVPPGETVWITACHGCTCDEYSLEAQEIIADCFITPCVDSIDISGQCCPHCPNGENCRAEFIDFNGTARSEVISVSDGVVDFGVVQCQCDHQNYYGEPRASCVQISTTPPPPTTTPSTTSPPTTTPAMCTCSDGTQVPPGGTHSISDCHSCYCDENSLQAQEMIADCFIVPCVDSVKIPGQCCANCPNGENCRAEFTDFNGKKRSEVISVSDGVVDFGAVQCQCEHQNYYGEPRASCVQITTPPPTTTPAMCTCSDGTKIPPGETVWITDCRGCYCDEYNLEAYEMIMDCFWTPCVDSLNVPGQCCPHCPNGENCRADFIDFNGKERSEIIAVSAGVVDFGAVQCQCENQHYYGEPRAICAQITTTPPPTTTPAMCTCSDGTQIPPGKTHSISDCHSCYCDENSLEAQEIIADCFIVPCVDSVKIPGQCCPNCPNGENCRAEFTDFNGKKRSEIISVSDGVVDFGSVECQCENQNYYGEARASCVQIKTTPPPTTTPAMCTCSDGTQVPPGETVWITDCHGCTCDKDSLQAYEMIADCFMTPCVDSVNVPGQCCPNCPNGENCRAEFIDDNGVERSEIIKVSDGVVKFNSTECQCDYQNYNGEPKANCVQVLSIEPVAAKLTTP